MGTRTRLCGWLVSMGLLASSIQANALDLGRVSWLFQHANDFVIASIAYEDDTGIDECGPADGTVYVWWDRLDPNHREKFVVLQTALVTRGMVGINLSYRPEDCLSAYNRLMGAGLFNEAP